MDSPICCAVSTAVTDIIPDVVFVHDIEFMPLLSTLAAISTLIQITDEKPGTIRNIGISGYSLPSLVRVARLARDNLPRPLDVVQV